MSHSKSYEFLLKDISTLNRVGQKTKKILKKKKNWDFIWCAVTFASGVCG